MGSGHRHQGAAGSEAVRVLSWTRPQLALPVLVIASLAISAWFAGYRLGGNDEGALLAAAGRLLRGGVFYRDVDAYPFPGAHYLLALAMGIFGESLAVARALAALVYAGVIATLYWIALPLLGRGRALLYGASLLSFKFLAWPAFTSFFYWDLSLLAACAAIALHLRAPDPAPPGRAYAVGICVGLAFVTKQSIGIYLGAAIAASILLRAAERRSEIGRADDWKRPLIGLIAGGATSVLPLFGYFAFEGLLPEMLYSGLVRPFTDYAATSGISYLAPLQWWKLTTLQGPGSFSYFPETYFTILRRELLPGGPGAYSAYWLAGELFVRWVYTALPAAFAVAAWLGVRERLSASRAPGDSRTGRLGHVTLLAGAVVLSAFPRADFAHMMGVYPLVLLLLFGLAREAARTWPRLERPLAGVEAGAVVSLLGACALLSFVNHANMTARLDLERASLRVHPDDAFVESVVRYVEDVIPEGEPLFVYGHEAFYYFLSGRYSPWPFSQLYPGQAGGDQGQQLADLLEEVSPRLIIRGFVHFPGVPGLPDQAPILHRFVMRRYEPDPNVFSHHPLLAGRPPPPHRLEVLRRREP